MLSSKENIADVQVQQIQSKVPPQDSGKEEGKLAQSEYDSVRATMSVSEEAIEINHSLAECASPPFAATRTVTHVRKPETSPERSWNELWAGRAMWSVHWVGSYFHFQ